MPVSPSFTKDYRASTSPAKKLREPRFTVAWESRRETLKTSFQAVVSGPKPPKDAPQSSPYFRYAWVRQPLPKRALLASALWHIILIYVPLPYWGQFVRQTNFAAQLGAPTDELVYYGPVKDLPLVNPKGLPAKPSPPRQPDKPLPRPGADAYHPRQTIISAPKVPTHPRQTLIQPDAPMEPPKILPQLPNIVRWTDPAQPARPRLQVSRDVLARLRPKNQATQPAAELPVPELPNLEKQPGDLNIASNTLTVPKPHLPVMSTAVPRVGPARAGEVGPVPEVPNMQKQAGDLNIASSAMKVQKPLPSTAPARVPQTGHTQSPADAGPVPNVRPDVQGGEAAMHRLVAISPSPSDAPADLPIPAGNLASRVSISPEGPQPGVPGGASGGGPGNLGGNSSTGGSRPEPSEGGNGSAPASVSISGGSPNSTTSGLGGLRGASSELPSSPVPRVESHPAPADADPEPVTPAASAASIRPGAAPESIFGPKRIFTLHVNMPNLASVTGSWVLHFVEIRQDDEPSRPAASNDLTGPVPLRKVDPKYPPTMINDRVEGEVVLYAVIRRDGSVDSIQLVKGIDPDLDNNAMEALSRWRFRPAERRGVPLELEAIVHIPFHAVAPKN